MTARITPQQIEQFRKFLGDALTALKLTKEQAQRVLRRGGVFIARLKALILALVVEYFILLSDDEAIAWMVKYGKMTKTEVRQIVEGLRKKARELHISDEVKLHAEALPNCFFKRDLSQMGPCWESFAYLQDWDFADPATEHALVSWIPAPLENSMRKSVSEQTAAIAAFKREVGLPDGYAVSFGSVHHVGGLALAHFNATGTDPFAGLVVRTDTCYADGHRLKLYWFEGCLSCHRWYWYDVDRDDHLAVFAVGVVKALGR